MNDTFTYETHATTNTLETYEWDNVWIEKANESDKNRILYVGDSISCAARRVCTEISRERWCFDGFGTSKAIDNPYFFPALSLFARQQETREAILFNNGLHGWHLDRHAYEKHYRTMIQRLLDAFPGTPIILLLTTPVADQGRQVIIKDRNAVVTALGKEFHLPVLDLYSVINNNPILIGPDQVHLTDEGYQTLAKTIISGLSFHLSYKD